MTLHSDTLRDMHPSTLQSERAANLLLTAVQRQRPRHRIPRQQRRPVSDEIDRRDNT